MTTFRGWLTPLALMPAMGLSLAGLAALWQVDWAWPAGLSGSLACALTWLLSQRASRSSQASQDTAAAQASPRHDLLQLLHQQLGAAATGSEKSALDAISRIHAIHHGSMTQLDRIRRTEANGQELHRIVKEKTLVDNQLASILEMFVETQEKEVAANLERLRRLQEVKNLGGMVEDIRHVARQTNFLSINAAIEAARAGESGRSFAVLAAEIRELSNRVGTLAQDIGQRILAATQGIDEELSRVNEVSDRSTSSSNMRQVIADIGDMQQRFADSMSQLHLQQVIAEVLEGHEQIEHQITDALSHVGAQDILRQQLECVQEALHELRNQNANADAPILTDYLANQAERFSALTPRDNPSASSNSGANNQQMIELFG